ncbi:uncharacterized protein LOC119579674 [Penaeus monodon]|uniref:uncharacterized protein LOC119579674 n=1 Tax=Penaeus monodon TaxID=6687 RepID=UPI0018A7BDE9|nr:uncharacterized protein LOC119579674 [Penaeus monodon]
MLKLTRTFSSLRYSLLLVLIASAMFTILHSKYLHLGPVSLTSAFVLTVAEPTVQDENTSTRPSPSFEIHKESKVDEQLLHNNTNASSTEVNFGTLVAQRFKERREHLEEQCSALRENLPIQVRSLFMNALFFVKKYNFFTCITPKVGSSTWKVHLLRMKGFSSKIRDPHDFNQHIALKFRKEKPEKLLRSKMITKVITVRHPISRLLSAYRNKLGGGEIITPNPVMFRFVRSVLKHFGARVARGKPVSVSFLSFMKFVVFQVDSGKKGQRALAALLLELPAVRRVLRLHRQNGDLRRRPPLHRQRHGHQGVECEHPAEPVRPRKEPEGFRAILPRFPRPPC